MTSAVAPCLIIEDSFCPHIAGRVPLVLRYLYEGALLPKSDGVSQLSIDDVVCVLFIAYRWGLFHLCHLLLHQVLEDMPCSPVVKKEEQERGEVTGSSAAKEETGSSQHGENEEERRMNVALFVLSKVEAAVLQQRRYYHTKKNEGREKEDSVFVQRCWQVKGSYRVPDISSQDIFNGTIKLEKDDIEFDDPFVATSQQHQESQNVFIGSTAVVGEVPSPSVHPILLLRTYCVRVVADELGSVDLSACCFIDDEKDYKTVAAEEEYSALRTVPPVVSPQTPPLLLLSMDLLPHFFNAVGLQLLIHWGLLSASTMYSILLRLRYVHLFVGASLEGEHEEVSDVLVDVALSRIACNFLFHCDEKDKCWAEKIFVKFVQVVQSIVLNATTEGEDSVGDVRLSWISGNLVVPLFLQTVIEVKRRTTTASNSGFIGSLFSKLLGELTCVVSPGSCAEIFRMVLQEEVHQQQSLGDVIEVVNLQEQNKMKKDLNSSLPPFMERSSREVVVTSSLNQSCLSTSNEEVTRKRPRAATSEASHHEEASLILFPATAKDETCHSLKSNSTTPSSGKHVASHREDTTSLDGLQIDRALRTIQEVVDGATNGQEGSLSALNAQQTRYQEDANEGTSRGEELKRRRREARDSNRELLVTLRKATEALHHVAAREERLTNQVDSFQATLLPQVIELRAEVERARSELRCMMVVVSDRLLQERAQEH